MLGYPDQALRRSQDAVDLARELSHPTTVAHALYLSAMFRQFRRERPETQELAEELEGVAAEHGLPTYLAGGTALRGWALAEGGQGEKGCAQIRQGLAASGPNMTWWRPYFRVLLAEACDRGGEAEEGLAVLEEALVQVADTKMGFYTPEMHRVKGVFLLARTPANSRDAEACFEQAIDVARRQSAKSLELRAVLSLSRLYHEQGKKEEAHRMLAEIYGWFTEGFDTVDLQEAKALLQVIS